jgi:YidC/Oxa1 family membrane protein insertase
MFDRRTLITVVVVGLILLLLPYYYKLISPQKPASPQPTTQPAPAAADTAKPAAAPAQPAAVAPVPAATSTTETSFFSDTNAVIVDYVTIETDIAEIQIASNACISEYNLKKYKTKTGKQVELHKPAALASPNVGLIDFDLGRANAKTISNKFFSVSKRTLNIQSGTDSVTFSASDSTGKQISITYVFIAGKYGFTVALKTSGLAVPETGEYKALWLGGVPLTEDPTRDLQYCGAYARVGDDIEKITVGRDGRKEFTATGQSFFVAARSKYFIAAVIPQEPAAGVDIIGRTDAGHSRTSPQFYDLTLRTAWKDRAAGRWTVYWGPIKYHNLQALNVGLEGTMNWGWQIIKPFSRGVLWMLTALGQVIPNYGIVIVLFSLMVKTVLWPLTRKSQISMKKMSALQPEIAALREQHKANPQALNKATMALYKERGVNPMSGCIPLLLQMPLLYALFIIFSTTIEFRQAPFMLWITDLSLPDVIYHLPFSIPMYGAGVAVLPLIMGITQFIMSKRTTTDPNQKMMVYIMPVFMTLIFNNFPSGLTLYYTLFNTLAIVEQNLIKLPDFTPSAVVVEDKKKKKLKG